MVGVDEAGVVGVIIAGMEVTNMENQNAKPPKQPTPRPEPMPPLTDGTETGNASLFFLLGMIGVAVIVGLLLRVLT